MFWLKNTLIDPVSENTGLYFNQELLILTANFIEVCFVVVVAFNIRVLSLISSDVYYINSHLFSYWPLL